MVEVLPWDGDLGRGASGGVGHLVLVEDTCQEVTWDQASGITLTYSLVPVRITYCPVSAPEQRFEMTEPGRLFVLANLRPVPQGRYELIVRQLYLGRVEGRRSGLINMEYG